MNSIGRHNNAGVLTPSHSNSRRLQLIALGGLLLVAILGIVGFVAVSSMNDANNANTPPPDLDTSLTRTSANGLYRGTAAPGLAPIGINQLHSWQLHLETADGQPVDDATITVHGDMPGHGHGLPTEPTVTKTAGAGNYLVEGMKFQMTGWWYVEFGIKSPKGIDTVLFNLILK
ncbi:MAG: FixH family protein [Chloroflexota bacterium]